MLRASILAVAFFALILSFQLKRPCLSRNWGGEQRLEYALLCYNDIQPLYGVRKLDQKLIPYVEERSYEYPVLIGIFMWLAALPSSNHVEYFLYTLPILAGMAFLSLVGLAGALGWNRRLLWFSAGTPLILYAFHNWDLIAVAPLCLAIWAGSRGREFWTGAGLGVGAAAKLFPGFVVPMLVVARIRSRSWGSAIKILLGAVAGWGILNLPVLLATYLRNGDISGWLGVFRFHAKRYPDFGTIWYWLAELSRDYAWIPSLAIGAVFVFVAAWLHRRRSEDCVFVGVLGIGFALATFIFMSSKALEQGPVTARYRELVDQVSLLLFCGGTLALLVFQWFRGRDPWAMGGAVVCLFLAVSKVHSPQYALWLLPFFLILETPVWMIVAYFAVDLLLLVSGFWWFVASPNLGPHFYRTLFVSSVALREALLVVLTLWYAFRARQLIELGSARSSAQAIQGR